MPPHLKVKVALPDSLAAWQPGVCVTTVLAADLINPTLTSTRPCQNETKRNAARVPAAGALVSL